jgi:uncharacterized protein YjiS (DUF1127 family)
METEMSANYPILPLGGSILIRAFDSVVALLTHWLKELVKARRHRREASVLAGVDQRMLADIGITRSDVRDAFSEPFWDDPTALLRERALERRRNRTVMRAEFDSGLRRAEFNSGLRR